MNQKTKQPFKVFIFKSWCLSLWFIVLVAVAATASVLQQQMNDFFYSFETRFQTIASAKVVRGTRQKSIDWHFVKALKANQPIYSLLRVNSNGKVISEAIRGEKPKRKTRSIAGQQWFAKMANDFENYRGIIKEETGRYYLIWANPIVNTSSSKSKKFGGAVVAKIDLWDCFHKISKGLSEPFLIKIGPMSLYNHKWDKEIEYIDEPLSVAGISEIFVRSAKPSIAVAADTSISNAASASPAAQMNISTPQTKKEKFSKLRNFVIIYWIVVLLILLATVVKFIAWLKFKMVQRRIDKENII